MANTPRIDKFENNKIINGNFDFWQRGIGPVQINGYSCADRFRRSKTASYGWEWSQSTDIPTQAQSGFQSSFSLKMETVTTAGALAAGETTNAQYILEGYDAAALYNKKMTFSFWIKSNKPGTYAVALLNGAEDRSYVSEYTIDAANTWEKKSVVVQHSDTGVWTADSSAGIKLIWDFGSGTNLDTATTDTWLAGTFISTANVANIQDTIGNTVFLSQVMLNEGEVAGSFSRAGRTISEELQMCQRYYEKSYDINTAPGTVTYNGAELLVGADASNGLHGTSPYKVVKRVVPTSTAYNPVTGGTGTWRNDSNGTNLAVGVTGTLGERSFGHSGAPPVGHQITGHWTADAEL